LPNTPVIAIVDDITFGKDGERSKPRVLEVQWRNIMGNGIDRSAMPTPK
jgi:hypothetical protein